MVMKTNSIAHPLLDTLRSRIPWVLLASLLAAPVLAATEAPTPETQQVAIDIQDIDNFSDQAWQEIKQGNPVQARELLSQAERRAEQTKQALKQLPDNTQTREQVFDLETKFCTLKDYQSISYLSSPDRSYTFFLNKSGFFFCHSLSA
jgi:hypothetical protein